MQQAGANALPDAAVLGTETTKSTLLEKMPEEGDVAIAGPPEVAVQTFLDYSLDQIEAMIDLVRGDLDRQQRTLMGALITIDVHARDVVRYMVKTKVGLVMSGGRGQGLHGWQRRQGWLVSRCCVTSLLPYVSPRGRVAENEILMLEVSRGFMARLYRSRSAVKRASSEKRFGE